MLALLAGAALGGPWIHAPGEWYAKAAYNEFRSGEYVDPATAGTPMEYRARSASLYAEAGLVRGLELVADLPYEWTFNRFPGSELEYRTDGLGSSRVGLAASIPYVHVPISVSVVSRIPLYGGAARLPLDPALGDEQVDVDATGAAGASIPIRTWRAWGIAEAGLRTRTGLIFSADPAIVDRAEAPLYYAQVGVLPSFRGHDLGWFALDAGGFANLDGARYEHRAACSAAIALFSGLHLEIGASDVYASRGGTQGWGWNLGISHTKD